MSDRRQLVVGNSYLQSKLRASGIRQGNPAFAKQNIRCISSELLYYPHRLVLGGLLGRGGFSYWFHCHIRQMPYLVRIQAFLVRSGKQYGIDVVPFFILRFLLLLMKWMKTIMPAGLLIHQASPPKQSTVQGEESDGSASHWIKRRTTGHPVEY